MSVTRLVMEEENESTKREVIEVVTRLFSNPPADGLRTVNIYVKNRRLVVEFEVPDQEEWYGNRNHDP